MAAALHALGIPAVFTPPNDIEVNGRKLGVVFLSLEERLLLANGTLLLDVDVDTMLKVLRVPKEKLSPEGVASARERLVTLGELMEPPLDPVPLKSRLAAELGRVLGVALEARAEPFEPLSGVRALAEPAGRSAALEAFLKTEGGTLYAAVALDPGDRRITAVSLSGPVHVRPPGLLDALSRRLRNVAAARLDEAVESFFRETDHELLGFGPAEVRRVLKQALARRTQQDRLGLTLPEANTLMLHDPDGEGDVLAVLRRVGAVLVPYCAKPVWCKWRGRDGCTECGRCEVGAAYRLARERGLKVTTVLNFEHLNDVLDELRRDGVPAYLGMCCRNFYLKREYAFREACMPALLLDISGANCYELGREESAYQGRFRAQARLNGPVVEKVMRFIPRPEADS